MTVEQIRYLLELIADREGSGYSQRPQIANLQGVLSIQLQIATERNLHSDPIPLTEPLEKN